MAFLPGIRAVKLLVLPVLLLNSSIAMAAQVSGSSSAPVAKPKPEPNSTNINRKREATGVVTQSACVGALHVHLKTDDGTLLLRAAPDADLSAAPKPCESLQGVRVKVHYLPDQKSGTTGTFDSLVILHSGDNRQASPVGNEAPHPNQTPTESSSSPETLESRHAVPVLAGEEMSFEGRVTEVICQGSEMTIAMEVSAGRLILHARDYTRVSYDQDVAFATQDYQACTQLKGKTASITFIAVEHKKIDGEIQSIEVEK
jgi:hypothetical protein